MPRLGISALIIVLAISIAGCKKAPKKNKEISSSIDSEEEEDAATDNEEEEESTSEDEKEEASTSSDRRGTALAGKLVKVTTALRREFKGITLSDNPSAAIAAAEKVGLRKRKNAYTKQDCEKGSSFLRFYDSKRRQIQYVDGLPHLTCNRIDPKAEKDPQKSGKRFWLVSMTFLDNELYWINIELNSDEKYEGLLDSLKAGYGKPTWTGYLIETHNKRRRFDATVWEDDLTAMLLYNRYNAATPELRYPTVSFFDLKHAGPIQRFLHKTKLQQRKSGVTF